jgi:hypothetical protein
MSEDFELLRKITMANASISVIIPAGSRYCLLKHTLKSIVPQLNQGDQLIVSSDQLSFEEKAKIRAHCTDRVEIKAIEPPPGLSIFEHWNWLIGQARNDCVVLLHDDEIYHAELLAKCRAEFGDPDVALIVGGQIRIQCRMSTPFVDIFIPKFAYRKMDGENWIDQYAAKGMQFCCSCYAFRLQKSKLKFLRRDQMSGDTLFVLDQALAGKVVELPMIQGTWLKHNTNTSSREYLQRDNHTYLEGLDELLAQTNARAVQTHICLYKGQIASNYWRNAFTSALLAKDYSGFAHCLATATALGYKPNIKERVLAALIANAFLLSTIIASVMKHLKDLIFAAKASPVSETQLAEILELPTELASNFLKEAQMFSKRSTK